MPNDELFNDFLKNGNIVEGLPQRISGKCAIVAHGTDSVIRFGNGVKLRDVRFEFPFGLATVVIEDGVELRGVVQVASGSTVEVAARTVFNRSCHLSAWEGASISIGSDCLFSNVSIRTSDMHSIIDQATGKRINPPRDTVIESNVWLGEKVTIHKGVTIGSGSIVGGNAVVTKSIARNVIAAGTPARVIRKGVTWDRAIVPAAKSPADPVPATWQLATKEEMAEQLKVGESQRLINEIDFYLRERGLRLSELESYAYYYYARAKYITCDFVSARELLMDFTARNPKHKAAQQLLSTLLAAHTNAVG